MMCDIEEKVERSIGEMVSLLHAKDKKLGYRVTVRIIIETSLTSYEDLGVELYSMTKFFSALRKVADVANYKDLLVGILKERLVPFQEELKEFAEEEDFPEFLGIFVEELFLFLSS